MQNLHISFIIEGGKLLFLFVSINLIRFENNKFILATYQDDVSSAQ